MSDNLQQLTEAGVSIWLDDLSRERIETGNLAELAKNDHVVGVTTNPSLFAAALSEGERYDDQVRELAGQGKDVDEVVFALTTTDVRNACDVIRDVYDATNGVDGRVSIEHYGASADYARIYQEFGITAEAVANAAEDSIRIATG